MNFQMDFQSVQKISSPSYWYLSWIIYGFIIFMDFVKKVEAGFYTWHVSGTITRGIFIAVYQFFCSA